jgi:hypothetical protein
MSTASYSNPTRVASQTVTNANVRTVAFGMVSEAPCPFNCLLLLVVIVVVVVFLFSQPTPPSPSLLLSLFQCLIFFFSHTFTYTHIIYIFNQPAWKLGLAQDAVILSALGAVCLLFPSYWVYSFGTGYASSFHFPKATSLFVASPLSDFLLKIIGMVALGFVVPLVRAITHDNIDFGVSVAYYHLVVAVVGLAIVFTSPAGSINRALLPFIAHTIMAMLLLFASIPNSSPLWTTLSKIHLA